MQYIHYILWQFPVWLVESTSIHVYTIPAHLSTAFQDTSFIYKQPIKPAVWWWYYKNALFHFSFSVCISKILGNWQMFYMVWRETTKYLYTCKMFWSKLQLSAMLKIWFNICWNQWIYCHFYTDGRIGFCTGALHSSSLKFSISADAWSFLYYFRLTGRAIDGLL